MANKISFVVSVILSIILISSLACGATYYIDFRSGNDNNDGLTPATAWKHFPDDKEASSVARQKHDNLRPGDEFLFKGGVVYNGEIEIDGRFSYGTPENPVVLRGDSWGSKKAIIDGSEVISGPWTRCPSQQECMGNPNWQNIYYATLQEDHSFQDGFFQDNGFLWYSQDPNPQDPFFYDRTDDMRVIPYNDPQIYQNRTSITDPRYFTQSDPDYWNGSYVAVWRIPNVVVIRKVTGFDPQTHTVYHEDLGNELYDDRDGHYAMLNHLSLIDRPGEFFLDEANRKLYVWPFGSGNPEQHNISVRRYGVGIYAYYIHDFIIEGFQIEKATMGIRLINGGEENTPQRVVIRNNNVRLMKSNGWYAIQAGGRNITISGNTVSNCQRAVGILAGGENITISDNLVNRTSRQGIWFMSAHNSVIEGNTVTQCKGTHANGISVYSGSENITVRNNFVNDSNIPFTMESSENINIYNNVFNANEESIYPIAGWGGLTGTINIIGNTILGSSNDALHISDCNITNHVVFKNNIADGVLCGDRSNNIYTMSSRTPSELYQGEILERDISKIFADPYGDFHLKQGSPAIDWGADLSEYYSEIPELCFDKDGNSRPQGSGWDIGAYEYVPPQECQPGDSFIRLNSTHIKACSCNQTDVQAAVDAADYTNTILVPEGNCTWNTTLAITKGINLQGAGIDKTIINIDGPSGYENAIVFNADKTTAENDYPFSVSGFTFKRISEFYAFLTLSNQELSHPLTKVTVHDNLFIGKEGQRMGIMHYLGVFGVVYNNTFQDLSHPWRFMGSGSGWNRVEQWMPGTANAMYYEDNYAYLSSNIASDLIVSGGGGNRYVARYNTINLSARGQSAFTQAYDIHGNQENNPTGGIGLEIYGNHRIGASGRWLDQRGGQVFFFYNQWTNTSGSGSLNVWEEFNDDDFSPVSCPEWSRYGRTSKGNCIQRVRNSYYWRNYGGIEGKSHSFTLNILFDHYDRSHDIVNNPLTLFENREWFRDNTEAFDGTIDPVGSCGYYNGPACTKSGIGCGTLEEMISITPSAEGLGFWVTNQSCDDISDMTGKEHKITISGVLYKSVIDGKGGYKWVPYYKPYIYPHPLRLAPFGTKICGEGQITEQCWCEGMRDSGYCCHGYYQTGQCSVCRRADLDCNGKIKLKELLLFVQQWIHNTISLKDLIDAIILWKLSAG